MPELWEPSVADYFPPLAGYQPGPRPTANVVRVTNVSGGLTVSIGGTNALINSITQTGNQTMVEVIVPQLASGAATVEVTTGGATVTAGTFTVN